MSEVVFKGYTAKQLDQQYNARSAVPGYEAIFADWRKRSAEYRRRCLCECDVAYGPGERETLDLFLPGRAGAPVHLFIHGGYWRLMDKSDFSFIAEALVAKGALTAIVNYGLCPAVTMDRITQQMRIALTWLFQNCGRYGGDPAAIHISGHSAGGQQTALLMATDWSLFDPDLPMDLVKSGVAISGIFDLEPIRHLPMNVDLKLDKATALRNSPIAMTPQTDAPLSLIVGGNESDEFHRQSREFSEKWRVKGANTRYINMPDRNHFTIVDQIKNQDDSLTRIMLRNMGLIRPVHRSAL